MSKLPKDVLALPLEQRALLALRAAVKKAIAERIREGLPVYIWSDGKVVEMPVRKVRSPRASKRPARARRAR